MYRWADKSSALETNRRKSFGHVRPQHAAALTAKPRKSNFEKKTTRQTFVGSRQRRPRRAFKAITKTQ